MSEILKIKSTHPESQGPYVLIDAHDFDEKVHELYDENEAETGAKSSSKKGAK
jgi:hypothetical protein